jgi:hypothetical protein
VVVRVVVAVAWRPPSWRTCTRDGGQQQKDNSKKTTAKDNSKRQQQKDNSKKEKNKWG